VAPFLPSLKVLHGFRLCRVHTWVYAGVGLYYLAHFKDLLELPKVFTDSGAKAHLHDFLEQSRAAF
jgi:hypothetical protein